MNLFLEFDAIVRQLNRNGVRYAVVGGLAVGLHGFLRATEDMDFLLHPDDRDAVDRLMVEELRFFRGSGSIRFKDSGMTLHRYMKPIEGTEDFHVVDFLLATSGGSQRIISGSVEVPFGDTEIKVAQPSDLIAMKRSRLSGKDEIDIAFLEGLKGGGGGEEDEAT